MNKRILIIASILVFMMLFNGCNTSEPKKEVIESVENTTVEDSISSEVNTNQPEGVKIDYDTIGFDLPAKESLFILNNSLLDVDAIKLLGEPEKKSEPVFWEADGLEHQTWFYNSKGIELDFTIDDENKQIVFSIYLQSPCALKTSSGLGIGSARSEVLKAYEHEINLEENSIDLESIVVGTVYGGLIFNFENDVVSSIFIGAAAE